MIYAQLKKISKIQNIRKKIYNRYIKLLKKINSDLIDTLFLNKINKSAYHLFLIIFKKESISKQFKIYLQSYGIAATFHYVPLHKSRMGKLFKIKKLKITETIYKKIVRIPFFPGLKENELNKIEQIIKSFFKSKKFN